MRLYELISTETFPYTKEVNDGDVTYKFTVGGAVNAPPLFRLKPPKPKGINYIVMFEQTESHHPKIGFHLSFNTSEGYQDEKKPEWQKKNVFKVFGTIEQITTEFLDEQKPDYLVWSSGGARERIYRRFNHPEYEFFQEEYPNLDEGLRRVR